MRAAELMFSGLPDNDIVTELWPPDKSLPDEDKKKWINNRRRRLWTLRNDPKFKEYYQSIVTEWKVHNVGPALNALTGQLSQTKDLWLQNKAANDVLNHAKEFHTTDEENTVTVRFEGMPELGEPTAEE